MFVSLSEEVQAGSDWEQNSALVIFVSTSFKEA